MAEKEAKSSDLLSSGRKAFQRCNDYENENRQTSLDDIKFSRLSQQWPSDIVKQRELEQRPVHTINKLKAFIRQVVNDARQNKPQIKVHPVDDKADVKTADIISGLIRNIEYTSNADVAYDTAIEASVAGGFGYWRVGMDYAYEDTFDMDICIERVANQFSIYGDPDSTSADSSDWNVAFVVDRISKEQFKAKYKGRKNTDGKPVTVDFDPQPVDFDSDSWAALNNTWVNDDGVMIAEWWTRTEEDEEIIKLSNGHIYCADELFEDKSGEDASDKYEDVGTDDIMGDIRLGLELGTLEIVDRRVRKVHKVRQVIMTGVDVLEENEWPGKYIPIVPVYGDEIILEGKRYFRSLIHDAKDAQRQYNYWKTTATELVALAPRVPWIGRKGTFDSDANRWSTANTQSHAYIEYDTEAPIRIPLDSGPAAGALNEALQTSDDMKAIIGLYDASLGARSNETSGKAIMARQREGDVATFHFIDNLTRAIRHTGRILIDLIPRIYNKARIVRVIGEDGKSQQTIKVNGPTPQMSEDGQPVVDEQGQAIMALHDLTAGKYDLTVTSGPSFTTRREEAAAQMTELVRAFPQAAPFVADIMAKNFDWPGADEIAKRFEAMNPANQNKGMPPQVQQMIEQGQKLISELQQKVNELEADKSVDQFNADTQRMKVVGELENDRESNLANVAVKASQKTPPRQG